MDDDEYEQKYMDEALAHERVGGFTKLKITAATDPKDILQLNLNLILQDDTLDVPSSLKLIIVDAVTKLDFPQFINPLGFILGRLAIVNKKLINKEAFKALAIRAKSFKLDNLSYKVGLIDIIRYAKLWKRSLLV